MRKFITRMEWKTFFSAIAGSTTEYRDKAMFSMTYKHGLRVSELSNIRLGDLDLAGRTVFIRRLKNGLSTVHPLQPETLFWIKKWLKYREAFTTDSDPESFLFVNNKGRQISRQWIYHLSRKYSQKAGLPVHLHPHMLRHACGYALANQGLDTRLIQDYLGHRNINHTVRYTASNVSRFRKVWQSCYCE
ncbi:tyrosine-type recombinase/integrase [Salmonella enterica]|nr:integrase [Salmonella enterica]EJT7258818.1 tyrosine-type recombinase/integrase [Salmonella enterica]ELI8702585.1 tyrosine-type recombinase/integrase [Salmonella enterica]